MKNKYGQLWAQKFAELNQKEPENEIIESGFNARRIAKSYWDEYEDLVELGVKFNEPYKVRLRKRCSEFQKFLIEMDKSVHPKDAEKQQQWDICSKI